MKLFHHMHFENIDPLGDGLREMIAAEREEPEAIALDEEFDGSLADRWQAIIDDAKGDPDYIDLMRSIDE